MPYHRYSISLVERWPLTDHSCVCICMYKSKKGRIEIRSRFRFSTRRIHSRAAIGSLAPMRIPTSSRDSYWYSSDCTSVSLTAYTSDNYRLDAALFLSFENTIILVRYIPRHSTCRDTPPRFFSQASSSSSSSFFSRLFYPQGGIEMYNIYNRKPLPSEYRLFDGFINKTRCDLKRGNV